MGLKKFGSKNTSKTMSQTHVKIIFHRSFFYKCVDSYFIDHFFNMKIINQLIHLV